MDFDKIFHSELLYKIKNFVSAHHHKNLESSLLNRYFIRKLNQETSNLFSIKAVAPQISLLGPYLYLIYTSDFAPTYNSTTATFTDDVAIVSVQIYKIIQMEFIFIYLLDYQMDFIFISWTTKWNIMINETATCRLYSIETIVP